MVFQVDYKQIDQTKILNQNQTQATGQDIPNADRSKTGAIVSNWMKDKNLNDGKLKDSGIKNRAELEAFLNKTNFADKNQANLALSAYLEIKRASYGKVKDVEILFRNGKFNKDNAWIRVIGNIPGKQGQPGNANAVLKEFACQLTEEKAQENIKNIINNINGEINVAQFDDQTSDDETDGSIEDIIDGGVLFGINEDYLTQAINTCMESCNRISENIIEQRRQLNEEQKELDKEFYKKKTMELQNAAKSIKNLIKKLDDMKMIAAIVAASNNLSMEMRLGKILEINTSLEKIEGSISSGKAGTNEINDKIDKVNTSVDELNKTLDGQGDQEVENWLKHMIFDILGK
ncbi:MAG: hypothetical protein NTZ10_03745 [Candidatus Saganbacteria bacterium]|nr:hypothetical protein [Candidatus Saganbacteria bacterium]